MTSWLIPLIIFDLAFLPVFHVYGLPFKISYVALGFLFLGHMISGTIATRYLSRDLLVLFALLIMLTSLGTLVFLLGYGGAALGTTIRILIIYVLAPVAFVVGAGDRRRWHGYVVFYILAYAAITLLFSVYYRELEWIARFYGLEERITEGAYAFRSQGLYFNANISALFMTMLFLYFVVGLKYRFVRPTALFTVPVIAAAFATVVVLQSRNQFLAIAVITFLLLRIMWAGSRSRKIATSALISVAALIYFSADLGIVAGDYLTYDPVVRLTRAFSTITDLGNPTESALRPLRSVVPAMARWSASPLVGTGFDISNQEPFGVISFHNDWLSVLTSAGMLGLFVFAVIVYRLARLDLIFLIPFLLPGMTNSFIFAPSHFLLFMLLAGMVWRRTLLASRPALETTVAASDLPPLRQRTHTG